MSYPPQQGYTAPHYGQPQPPGQQQNNLWLIGGTVLVVLVIIMTVILLIVQRTAGNNAANGGGETEEPEPTGNEHTEELDPVAEFSSDACNQLDFSVFEAAVGEAIDYEENSSSESSSSSYNSVTCYFYTEDYNSVNISLYDYEEAEDAINYIEYDEESYGSDPEYEFSEYTAYGDAGSVYTRISEPSYQTTYLHVALGSLEISMSGSYDATEGVQAADVAAGLEDIMLQLDALYADFQ
ncbi:hypothetical protein AB0B28_20600 [Glycomyces sp. NPDC046736]|uniref:hypothetical protein n=1 Tax=Glycomyces sp. NPDC046736 TaxID=3155615 RepID=UPI0033F88879